MIVIGFGIPWATTAGVMSRIIVRMMSTGYFADPFGPVAILSGCTLVGLIGSFCWGWLDTKSAPSGLACSTTWPMWCSLSA